MVYEKYQISLFEKGGNLPKMLVEIDKRADEIFLVSKQQKAESGLLFAFYQSKYFMMEIGSAFCEFALKSVDFSKSIAVAFFGASSLFLGGNAMTEDILKRFKDKREEFLKEKKNPKILNFN